MRGEGLLSPPSLLSVLCVLGASLQTNALSWGRCPDLPVKQAFSLNDYQGFWFEQAGYNTKLVEGDKRCVYALYYLDKDNVFHVQNHGIDNRSNRWGGVNGTAAFTDPASTEAKLTVTFKFGWWKVQGPYWVLDTDYTNYTVVYSCENFLYFFHYYTVWILSRTQTFNSTEDRQIFFNTTYRVLTDHAISASIITPSEQTNCSV